MTPQEKRITEANEKWLARSGPKRQKAKDNAWKNKNVFRFIPTRRLKG